MLNVGALLQTLRSILMNAGRFSRASFRRRCFLSFLHLDLFEMIAEAIWRSFSASGSGLASLSPALTCDMTAVGGRGFFFFFFFCFFFFWAG